MAGAKIKNVHLPSRPGVGDRKNTQQGNNEGNKQPTPSTSSMPTIRFTEKQTESEDFRKRSIGMDRRETDNSVFLTEDRLQ